MKFVSIVHLFWDGCLFHFWCFRWYLYRSHMQPAKPSKPIGFTANVNDFTLQRNMNFDDDLHEPFRYKFWHWFSMSLASIWAPFWDPSGIKFHVLVWFFESFFSHYCPTMVPKSGRGYRPFSVFFRDLFPQTSSFYVCKIYKCHPTVTKGAERNLAAGKFDW